MKKIVPHSVPSLITGLSIVLASGYAHGAEETPVVEDSQPGENHPGGLSAEEAAEKLANPNNSLASLTFRNQYRTYGGDLPGSSSEGNYTMLFQPVFPFIFDKGPDDEVTRKLFVRPAIPFQLDQPVFDPDDGKFDSATGLGDIGFDVAYGFSWDSGEQLALGMVGTLPTATGQVPGGNMALGPEIFTGIGGKWGFLGLLATHQWDVESWSDGDVNKTTVQPIFTYLLNDGWAVGTAGIFEYNWLTDEASIPINAFVQKTVKFGDIPTRIQLEVSYFVERPDTFGPEWFVGLNLTPVVRNIFQR